MKTNMFGYKDKRLHSLALDLMDRADRRYRGSDKKVVHTLDAEGIYMYDRRKGNTVRQIDFAIDALFNKHIVLCLDHHESGNHRRSNERLLDLIMNRLYNEHRLTRQQLRVDIHSLTIEILDQHFYGRNY